VIIKWLNKVRDFPEFPDASSRGWADKSVHNYIGLLGPINSHVRKGLGFDLLRVHALFSRDLLNYQRYCKKPLIDPT